MTAVIDGITVTGTPQEIDILMGLRNAGRVVSSDKTGAMGVPLPVLGAGKANSRESYPGHYTA